VSATEVTAIERHAAALARDLAYWKNLPTTRAATLTARALKAEQERDEAIGWVRALAVDLVPAQAAEVRRYAREWLDTLP